MLSLLLTTPHEGTVMGPDEAAMLGAGLLFAGPRDHRDRDRRGSAPAPTNPDERAARPLTPPRSPPRWRRSCVFLLPRPREDDEQRTGLMRYAREDIEFNGVDIAAGELVLLGLRTANQDTVHFPDPARCPTSPACPTRT